MKKSELKKLIRGIIREAGLQEVYLVRTTKDGDKFKWIVQKVEHGKTTTVDSGSESSRAKADSAGKKSKKAMTTKESLKETQLWSGKDDTKPYVDALTKLGKKVGWAGKPQVSTLGGTASIMWRFTFDKESDWTNKIVQNGLLVNFRIEPDGTIELFNKSHKVRTKFRTAKYKDVNGMVKKIQTYIDKAKKEL